MNPDTARKELILGCAATGAKFTPHNHRKTGDQVLDAICAGAAIKNSPAEAVAEAAALYELGCRYYHYHARNPFTGEQATDSAIYAMVSRGIQRRCPDMVLSFGASRNGPEVRDNIEAFGEWERVSQCGLPLHLGGAHFVTIQAAVELQVVIDLERRLGIGQFDPVAAADRAFVAAVADHAPAAEIRAASLDSYSTSGGADYGKTSPRIQFEVYRNAVRERMRLNLFHEVEWVQWGRSMAMTRYAVEHPRIRLGGSGQINIALLFGFSPRMPFPADYHEFKDVVAAAKSLECDAGAPSPKRRRVTVTVGAAVLPQHASGHIAPLDVGPRRGTPACALRRLACWAAQPDSGVDVLRVGMEDTPYAVTDGGRLRLADNADLLALAIDEVVGNGAGILLDGPSVSRQLALDVAGPQLLARQRRAPLGGVEATAS
jgi:uncharacterized protein (DUF849 family)